MPVCTGLQYFLLWILVSWSLFKMTPNSKEMEKGRGRVQGSQQECGLALWSAIPQHLGGGQLLWSCPGMAPPPILKG